MNLTFYDWLPMQEWWLGNGFTKEQLENGIVGSGINFERITSTQVFEREPTHYKPHELVDNKKHGSRRLVMQYQGHEWERTENFIGDEYRIPNPYKQLEMPKFTRHMLGVRIPWFQEFKWLIYGYPGENGWPERFPYEIYMHAQDNEYAQEIYCPVFALLTGNEEAIIKRNTEYAKSYNNEYYSPALLQALESPLTKRMLDYLTGRLPYEVVSSEGQDLPRE